MSKRTEKVLTTIAVVVGPIVTILGFATHIWIITSVGTLVLAIGVALRMRSYLRTP